MPEEKPNCIAVLGLGLLGTSLCMALKKRYPGRLLAWARNSRVMEWVKDHGIAEIVSTPEQALAEADLTILCLPVPVIMDFIVQYGPGMKPGAVLTDIGSVKGMIAQAAERVPQVNFIGSHPMAGTEKTGPWNAFPELYDNADVFVVPAERSSEADIMRVESFWKSIGTHTTRIGADEHDVLVARTSHVPHLLAASLVLSVLDTPDEQELLRRFAGCATGFRDTSRIASSSAVMWREIIEQNTPAVLEAMTEFRRRFDRMERSFREGNFAQFEQEFAKGAFLRGKWLAYKENSEKKYSGT